MAITVVDAGLQTGKYMGRVPRLSGLQSGLNVVVVTPTIAQGQNEPVNITGATPNGQVQVQILTNSVPGQILILQPNFGTNSAGAVDVVFLVGTNIPAGVNTIKVLDLSSNTTTTANFTVTTGTTPPVGLLSEIIAFIETPLGVGAIGAVIAVIIIGVLLVKR